MARLCSCGEFTYGLMILLQALNVLLMLLGAYQVLTGDGCNPDPFVSEYTLSRWLEYLSGGVAALLAAPASIWLVSLGTSGHLITSAFYATMSWSDRTTVWLFNLSYCWHPSPESRGLWWGANFATRLGLAIAQLFVPMQRLFALEKTALRSIGTRVFRPTFGMLGLAALAMLILYVSFNSDHTDLWLIGYSVIISAFVISYLLLVGLMCRTSRMALLAAKSAPPEQAARATTAAKRVRFEMLCIWTAIFTTLPAHLAPIAILPFTEDYAGLAYRLSHVLPLFIDTIANAIAALVISGALTGAAQAARRRRAADKQRSARRKSATAKFSKDHVYGEATAWDDKVKELAGRGMTLSAMLEFYRELPNHMPHFDPTRSTTSDVTRHAIIPLSAPQKQSYAEVVMGSHPILPSRMVTHSWANLFRDLLAAIVADALGENEFSLISRLLMEDWPTLERWVARLNVGERAYWVCAFSVNQHAGICGNPGTRRLDTVLQQPYPACRCGFPKAWNDTQPVLANGRSIPCEMNKFEDMMKYLSAQDPSYEQVVAIDKLFGTFSRAWCVAELATAREMGMTQSIKVFSAGSMEENSESLRRLRIQDMEASRQEDKDEILAGIEDVDAFNASLQILLFEDLFPSWKSLDGEEKMKAAGRIIRWMESIVWHKGA